MWRSCNERSRPRVGGKERLIGECVVTSSRLVE